MRKTLVLLAALSIIIVMGLVACSEDESYYDIVVVNDAWLFGTCSIHLDGEFQFKLKVEESAVIEGVREGKHTITAKDDDGDIIAKQTLDVSRDQKWLVSDHFSLDWLFEW